MVKIYTKTGDKGTSSIGSKRLPKTHIYFKTLGSIDLLNSNIGMLIYLIKLEKAANSELLGNQLTQIQSSLMKLSSYVIGYFALNLSKDTQNLENEIDLMEQSNTPLTNFILPQGPASVVNCHNIRALCRQSEINIIELLTSLDCLEVLKKQYEQNYDQTNIEVLEYINRLSDYFFVLARYLNNHGNNDIIWKV